MFIRSLKNLSAVFCGLILIGVGLVWGQMLPDAPIENFKLPGFDSETGYRTWELKGSEVSYVDENQVLIQDMVLTSFQGRSGVVVDFKIESPKAAMFLKEGAARGDSPIRVTGDGFVLVGRDWSFENKKKKLVIRKNARVVFEQNLDYIIK
jgi:hypothetical protein